MHWNFPIFCHWAFIIFISKTSFPTKMETIKLNIPFLLDILSLKALVVHVCVWSHCNLKPHTFFENGWWYCEIIEWTNNHIFIFILQPRNDPMYDTRSRWHNVMPSMTQVSFTLLNFNNLLSNPLKEFYQTYLWLCINLKVNYNYWKFLV